MVRAESPTSERYASPPPAAPVRSGAVAADVQGCRVIFYWEYLRSPHRLFQSVHCQCAHVCASFLSGDVRAVALYLSQNGLLAGGWAAATINSLGMRSLEWGGPLFHANPLGHRVPA